MKHRPPEGRKHKHNKPKIPVSNSNTSQRQQHPGEATMPGPVDGTLLARRLLFRTDTTRQGWAFDMLIAVAAAKQMGATTFEIAVDGQPQRQPVQRREGLYLFGGGPEPEPWQRSATETGTCTISIYALVVE